MYMVQKSTYTSVWVATDGTYTTGSFHNYKPTYNTLTIKPYDNTCVLNYTPTDNIPFILCVTVDA